MAKTPLDVTVNTQAAFQGAVGHCTHDILTGPWDLQGGPQWFSCTRRRHSVSRTLLHPKLLHIRSRGCPPRLELCDNTRVLPGEQCYIEQFPREICLTATKATSSQLFLTIPTASEVSGSTLEVHAPHCKSAPDVNEKLEDSNSQPQQRYLPNIGVWALCTQKCHLPWWK